MIFLLFMYKFFDRRINHGNRRNTDNHAPDSEKASAGHNGKQHPAGSPTEFPTTLGYMKFDSTC